MAQFVIIKKLYIVIRKQFHMNDHSLGKASKNWLFPLVKPYQSNSLFWFRQNKKTCCEIKTRPKLVLHQTENI